MTDDPITSPDAQQAPASSSGTRPAPITAEQLRDWARMMEIEFVHISKDTTVESLEQELFLNDLAWKLK